MKLIVGSTRRRYKFTDDETRAIRNGVERFGVGHWSTIKKVYGRILENRSNVQIKDAYRTMLKAGDGAPASPETKSKRRRTFTDREKNAIVVGVRRLGLGKWKEIQTTFGASLQHRSPTENHPTPPSRQILPRGARNDVSYTSDTSAECDASVDPPTETNRSESPGNQDKKEQTLTTRGKRSAPKPAPPQKRTSPIKKKRKVISTEKTSIVNTRILRSTRSRLRS
jgi:hypothetical protein